MYGRMEALEHLGRVLLCGSVLITSPGPDAPSKRTLGGVSL